MNERQLRQQIVSLSARLDAIEAKLGTDAPEPARIDAIEAAVDQISNETGTGPAPDAEAEPPAPSVPRRTKEKAK